MKKSFFCILVICLSFSIAFGADANKSQAEAKAVMGHVYESFVKIIPYVYADKSHLELLRDKKNQDELIANLTDIATFFKGAKHIDFFQKPGFKPSLETINSHLEDTILSLQSKNYLFIQNRLKGVTALCVSCHSQLSETMSKNAFGTAINSEKRSKFDSDFAYANYLFLVRRFTEATNYFEMSIRSNLEKTQNATKGVAIDEESLNNEVFSSLKRVLTIYTKIALNPEKGISFLKKYQSEKNISKMTRNTMKVWILSLEKWKGFDVNTVKSINEFIEKNLKPLENSRDKIQSGEKDITLLVASGVLSKYMSDHPTTELAPEILYWLSIAERRLSSTYFFSLSDLYLKDCIVKYPKSPYAKQCFQEYEDNIEFGYSGSGGTDIPKEEKLELERLKKLIK